MTDFCCPCRLGLLALRTGLVIVCTILGPGASRQALAVAPPEDAFLLDHNGDGTIDSQDLLLFLRGWMLEGVIPPTPSSTPTLTLTPQPTETLTPTLGPSPTPTVGPVLLFGRVYEPGVPGRIAGALVVAGSASTLTLDSGAYTLPNVSSGTSQVAVFAAGFYDRHLEVFLDSAAFQFDIPIERIPSPTPTFTLTLTPTATPSLTPTSTVTPTPTATFEGDFAVAFPDRGLELLFRMILDRPEGDIRKLQLEGLSGLYSFSGLDIENLEGLQYCTGVTRLNLSDNRIEDLSILASLVQLEELELDQNHISHLSPLSALVNLHRLQLSANLISDVSALSALSNLSHLSLFENDVSDLSPLVNNAGLGAGDELLLSGNPIDSTPAQNQISVLEARGVRVDR